VCGDEQTVALIAADSSGATLDDQDRAVYEFAGEIAANASSVTQADVDELRAAALSDFDVADVVFAAAARSVFTRVLDGLGAQLDHQTGAAFPSELLRTMIVGRPPSSAGVVDS
jgi:alkylhydroperoxidase family enzyme